MAFSEKNITDILSTIEYMEDFLRSNYGSNHEGSMTINVLDLEKYNLNRISFYGSLSYLESKYKDYIKLPGDFQFEHEYDFDEEENRWRKTDRVSGVDYLAKRVEEARTTEDSTLPYQKDIDVKKPLEELRSIFIEDIRAKKERVILGKRVSVEFNSRTHKILCKDDDRECQYTSRGKGRHVSIIEFLGKNKTATERQLLKVSGMDSNKSVNQSKTLRRLIKKDINERLQRELGYALVDIPANTNGKYKLLPNIDLLVK